MSLPAWLALPQQLPEPEHEPGTVNDLADEIMSRPEYREPPESLIERVGNWVGDRLAEAMSGLSLGGALPSFVAWIVLTLLLAGVAYLVARSVRAGSWSRSPRPHREDAAVILSTDEHRSPSDWSKQAVAHETEGRWREGLLCRYRSLVTELVARGVLAEVVGRTAGEYVQDVNTGWPELAPPFVAATDLFEAAWYGGRETGPAERDQFAALAERTLSASTADRVAATTASHRGGAR